MGILHLQNYMERVRITVLVEMETKVSNGDIYLHNESL